MCDSHRVPNGSSLALICPYSSLTVLTRPFLSLKVLIYPYSPFSVLTRLFLSLLLFCPYSSVSSLLLLHTLTTLTVRHKPLHAVTSRHSSSQAVTHSHKPSQFVTIRHTPSQVVTLQQKRARLEVQPDVKAYNTP